MDRNLENLFKRVEIKKEKFWDKVYTEDEEIMANDLLDDAIDIIKLQQEILLKLIN